MAKLSPLARVKAEFGSKEKLVEKVLALVERGEESKEDLKNKLKTASNQKLMRLHQVATEVKDKFGTKEKLADAVLKLANKTKDKDYRTTLLSYSPGKLLDLYRSGNQQSKADAKRAA